MNDPVALALESARRLRESPAFASLGHDERASLERDWTRVEAALARDPYALSLDATALEDPIAARRALLGPGQAPPRPTPQPAPPPAAPAPPSPLNAIGRQAAEALDAVDFAGFVAGLVNSTFQAIVDASAQQIREYAELVASISRTVDDFAQEKVTPNQVRDWLAERHAQDLRVVLPAPGRPGAPRLAVRPDRAGTSPGWLGEYGLGGQELSDELVEGRLIERGRTQVAEQRLQTLATLVLMGINRIVVNDGEIRARLQFHASAREKVSAEAAQIGAQQGGGIAARNVQLQTSSTTMVSTIKANAQAEANIRADLMGAVRISFKTETFPLERFADSAALQLINRHARVPANAPAPAATPAPAAPPTPRPAPGGREP